MEVLFYLSSSLLTFVNENARDLLYVVLACVPQNRDPETKAYVLLLYFDVQTMGTGLRGKGSESGKERETIHDCSNELVAVKCTCLFYLTRSSPGESYKVCLLSIYR